MKLLVFLLLFVSLPCAHARDSVLVTDGFRAKPEFTGRKIVATGAIGGMLVTSLVWSYDTWWRDAGRPFRFHSENWLDGPVLGIDKVGHFYTSYFYFHTFRNIMLWGGYEPSSSDLWATLASAFFAVAIEVGDGVTPRYGFDYQDIVFNFGGIGYGLLQSRIPFLRNFTFKWSYIPNDGYRFPVRFTDNYDAHTYWLACDINNLLPSALEPYWPDFLQIAVGMSVDEHVTRREFAIGLDLNLGTLFSPRNEDWLLLVKTVNMFHFPAPAVKFTEGKEPRYFLFHKN